MVLIVQHSLKFHFYMKEHLNNSNSVFKKNEKLTFIYCAQGYVTAGILRSEAGLQEIDK